MRGVSPVPHQAHAAQNPRPHDRHHLSQRKTEMDTYLRWAAIATALLVVGATAYQYLQEGDEEGALNYRLANQRLEDGLYPEALAEFDAALKINPRHAPAYLGRALALMGLNDVQGALQTFDEALHHRPDFAAVHANRGILLDRLGRHEEALGDYRRALELDPELGEGPDWLTRFFRSQYDRPPTIADRAAYLEAELKKHPGQRQLSEPEQDAVQRAYKYEGE